jgi:DNA-directed RNA polymerase specialized sigma24 family protein
VNLNDEQRKLVDEIVRSAAVQAANNFPTFIEADDVAQDVWVKLLDAPAMLNKLLDDENVAGMKALIHKIAWREAIREREDYEVYKYEHIYGVDDVKRVIATKTNEPELEDDAEVMDFTEALETLYKRNRHGSFIRGRWVRTFLARRSPSTAERLRR